MNAVKLIAILGIFAVILISGCAQQQKVGGTCGTVSPDSRDKCCDLGNANTAHADCAGQWKWQSGAPAASECSWICNATEPILGASCGTVTPGYNDECCASRNVNTTHGTCIGAWKYSPTGDPKTECSWICGASADCVKEGGYVGGAPPSPGVKPRLCCSGLAPVPAIGFDASGECSTGYSELSACTKCGDGTCGIGENFCNCPKDCSLNCTQAGGTYVFGSGKKCCGGLKPVSCNKPDENGTCTGRLCVDTGICANCGDGVCGTGENKCNCPEDCNKTGPVGMANPASVYCADSGYKLEIRTDASGGQFGVCVFPDASECDEWAFFRGTCGEKFRPGAGCICTMEYNPVCGINNKTYGNACGANCEKMPVAYPGECK